MLFAEELPTSLIVPGQAVTIVIVFGVLLFVLNIACAILVIVGFNKRKPAIEAEFSTKKETLELFGRLERDIRHVDTRNEELARQIFTELKSLSSSMNHELAQINRSLGKLEGPK